MYYLSFHLSLSFSISLAHSLQGEFYNIGQHKEPPFSPAPFSLPPQDSNMLYIGLSAFTLNSAGFVYNNAGVLSLYVTDDMVSHNHRWLLLKKNFNYYIINIITLEILAPFRSWPPQI